MHNEEQQEDDNQREEEQNQVLCIDCDDQQNNKPEKHNVVSYHGETHPQEGNEEAFEDGGDRGHCVGEGDGFGGVQGGDGEDDGGGGKEGENEEEDEVTKLKDEEFSPLGGVGAIWILDLGD